jgi:hypothetical protein
MQRPELPPEVERRLRNIVEELAKRHGMERSRALTTALRHFFAQKAGAPLATTAPLYPGIRGWELAPAQTQ